MDKVNENISARIHLLKAKFDSGSLQQNRLRKQSKLILGFVWVAAILLVVTFTPTAVFAISENFCITDFNPPVWAANLSEFLSPLAIMVSVLMAAYLALNQLIEKVKRDKVEHAHDLCSSAPDINIVFASIGPLNNHLEEAYKNCLEASHSKERLPLNDDPWDIFVTKMEQMADDFPSAIKSTAQALSADHKEEIYKVFEALAFFDKTAIAICDKHADDGVFWSRYNHAGFSIWIYSFPIIISCWILHMNSYYLSNSKSFGEPFEHFEAWLRYHSGQAGNAELDEMMDRLSRIRKKVLEAQ
tara:strand:+ start:362 stop:1264 length:903 start_codon:yes stop_codon:yes gene_type:complete